VTPLRFVGRRGILAGFRVPRRIDMHKGHDPAHRVHVGDFLLACLNAGADDDVAEASELLRSISTADIYEAARYHRVVAPVHEVLSRIEPADPEIVDKLAALRREAVLASFRVVRALQQAGKTLADNDLRWLVVKGPVLSEVVYARRGVRTYHDLDVLVRPADFKRALEALEGAGFRLLDPNWKFHRRWVASELRVASSGGADVDLHWHLLFAREIRRSFRMPIADLVDRAREVSVHNMPVLTLDTADTLLHLAVHACRECGDRLYWLKDIEQSIVNEKPDWNDVVTRAHEWRVHILVGTMLARTRTVLNAPVPDEVIRALLPRAWRSATIAADRLFPPQRSDARGSLATLFAHGARDSVRSSASAIGSDVRRMLGQLAGGQSWRREEWDRARMALDDPRDPNSKRFPAGDERDRAWLLDELLRETTAA
jgi:hypothetical protein